MQQINSDTPPPYDDAVPKTHDNKPKAAPDQQFDSATSVVLPHRVSLYEPTHGEHITSLLPPDHPEMICLQQGQHVTEARFGLIGLLAAVFWFPLGIGLCLLDRQVRCTRCGVTTREGMCGGI